MFRKCYLSNISKLVYIQVMTSVRLLVSHDVLAWHRLYETCVQFIHDGYNTLITTKVTWLKIFPRTSVLYKSKVNFKLLTLTLNFRWPWLFNKTHFDIGKKPWWNVSSQFLLILNLELFLPSPIRNLALSWTVNCMS